MSEFSFSCPACHQDILCDTARAGTQIACPVCNATITVPDVTAGTAGASASAHPPPLPGSPAPTAPRTSGLAVASLVCSLSSLITCVGWLPGIICGHLARSRIRRDPSLKGSGLATAGLVIGYFLLAFQVAIIAYYLWIISSAVKQGIQSVQQDLETNTIIVTQTQSPTASNENQTIEPVQAGGVATNNPPAESVPAETTAAGSPAVESGNAGWTSDLSSISFPGHPASGKLHGLDFVLTNAQFRGGDLRIRSANGLMLDVYRLGTNVESRNYFIETGDVARASPHVRITWSEGGVVQTATFTKGFAMKLQFGPAANRTMSGKIYLCLPDEARSWVAGTFKIRLPQSRPRQTR